MTGPESSQGEHPVTGGGDEEREELRRYIAANVIGDNPPPLTAEARALIRAALGPDQEGETSSTA
jgi:hypothetical protein